MILSKNEKKKKEFNKLKKSHFILLGQTKEVIFYMIRSRKR